ncbi:aldehyde dehydrogenase family protein [Armatimonas rosea]|uniref:Aldehyde dehydrogenase (NAD+) n=1 Tax=Armatimonas rosea TaxID=685828 RepID=A0A7W9STI6_ARMRO|nr:aldehyde dehydrogenase family protein [Armatimonas rosea]MBB6052120.1 aldehyde dehydrogenase (NAD+) [Armatimonas rosea]
MSVAEIFETMDYGPAPESAAPALAWLSQHQSRFGHFIGGAWTAPTATFPTNNPATGTELAQLSQGSAEDIAAAVAAARTALPAWRALGGAGRARYLYALARQVQKHARLFAVLETLDNGKPIRETRDIDIPLVARHFYHHAGWATLLESEFPGYEGVGVCGQIIPWNFPLLMLAWKIAPALATGSTVVLKPAEFTSLTALLFAEICQEVGLPDGVVNIVTGDGTTGAALVAHPEIDKLAFTGSTEVGRLIRKATAGSGKKLTLELGGKSPFLVFEDADLDAAVEGVVDAIWFNQGQVCCAGSRLLVQESIEARFIEKLKRRMETLRVGDPMDKVADIGAIVAPVQLARISELVQAGVEEGATLYQTTQACPTNGCFYPPTLLTGVAPASVVAQQEIFGPVLVAMSFRTPAEAVALANNTPYGLAASLWSESLNQCLELAPKLKAGTIWINGTNLFDAAAGFGGYRESGFGREGGREGLWEYLVESTPVVVPSSQASASATKEAPTLDQTAKLYIGGKQARPDSGYSRRVLGPDGTSIGLVGEGSRKDLRNAVEAARAASAGWGTTSGHNRAQILYYLAENLNYRSTEFAARIAQQTGLDGTAEVDAALQSLFVWAAWADKNDGAVHRTVQKSVVLAMPEPLGVLGIACPSAQPLLGLINTVAPAIALGNAVIAVPSEAHPLSATDFYQVLETSDVPSGVVNIVTGERDALLKTLAEHDDVDGVWYFGENPALVEAASVGNLKRTWCPKPGTLPRPDAFLRAATQVKNIWLPYTDELPW